MEETISYLSERNIQFFFLCFGKTNENIGCLMENVDKCLISEPEYLDETYLVDVKYTKFGYESIAPVHASSKALHDFQLIAAFSKNPRRHIHKHIILGSKYQRCRGRSVASRKAPHQLQPTMALAAFLGTSRSVCQRSLP